MKALVKTDNALILSHEVEEPTPARGEVKVRVHYASLNPTDLDIADGHYDLFLKLYRVKSPVVTGLEFSGTVMQDSVRFQTGDRVFGYTHLMKGPKTHQEIISIPEDFVAVMPGAMSFAEAAAFPLGAQTSLVALRDVARLRSGQAVLIIGGSGGLGVFAIQIARSMGVAVTGVSGPQGLETMRALGADTVIDYRATSMQALNETFEAIVDLSNTYRFRDLKHLLTVNGIFIPVDPLRNLPAIIGSALRRKKTGYLFVEKGDGAMLSDLATQVADGSLDVSRYQAFALDDHRTAEERLRRPGNIGRTVLRMV